MDIFFEYYDYRKIPAEWSAETLLSQRGYFRLEDVAAHLDLPVLELKKKIQDILIDGKNPFHVIGARRVPAGWLVLMERFSEFAQSYLSPRIRLVEDDWDANELLAQSGRFYLRDVCDKLPFTLHQIRYRVQQTEGARQHIGVWRDPDINAYLVDMTLFSAWIRKVWFDFRVT